MFMPQMNPKEELLCPLSTVDGSVWGVTENPWMGAVCFLHAPKYGVSPTLEVDYEVKIAVSEPLQIDVVLHSDELTVVVYLCI